jgi:hypothetical protein
MAIIVVGVTNVAPYSIKAASDSVVGAMRLL